MCRGGGSGQIGDVCLPPPTLDGWDLLRPYSFWGTEQVSTSIGSKVMTQNAQEPKSAQEHMAEVAFKMIDYFL